MGPGPCLKMPLKMICLKKCASLLTRTKEIILDGGMGALLASVEVDSSPLWSGIANINSRDVVIDAHQVKFRQRTHFEKFINEKFIYISFRNLSTLGPMR